MSEAWKRVDSHELKLHEEKTLRGGIKITVGVAPFDVPQFYRVMEDDEGRVTLEFRYMDHESYKVRRIAPGIKAGVGKNSQRLFHLELDPSVMREEALRQVQERSDEPKLQGHFLAIQQLLAKVCETNSSIGFAHP